VLTLYLESFKNLPILFWLSVLFVLFSVFSWSTLSLKVILCNTLSYYSLQHLHFFRHHGFAFATLPYICNPLLHCRPFFFLSN